MTTNILCNSLWADRTDLTVCGPIVSGPLRQATTGVQVQSTEMCAFEEASCSIKIENDHRCSSPPRKEDTRRGKQKKRDRTKQRNADTARFRERGLRTRKQLSKIERREYARFAREASGTNHPSDGKRRERLWNQVVERSVIESSLIRAGVEPNPGPQKPGARMSHKKVPRGKVHFDVTRRAQRNEQARVMGEQDAARDRAQEDVEAMGLQEPEQHAEPHRTTGRVMTVFEDPSNDNYVEPQEPAPQPNATTENGPAQGNERAEAREEEAEEAAKPLPCTQDKAEEEAKPDLRPLDGARPEARYIESGLAELGFVDPDVTEIAYRVKKMHEHDLRIIPDRGVPIVKQPYILGRISYSVEQEVDDMDFIDWVWSFFTELRRDGTIYFAPHLVSAALLDSPHDTNFEAIRANVRARIRRIPGFPVTDKWSLLVVEGSEIVATCCALNQLNSTWAPDPAQSEAQWSVSDCDEEPATFRKSAGRYMPLATGRMRRICQHPRLRYSLIHLYACLLSAVFVVGIIGVLIYTYRASSPSQLIETTQRQSEEASPRDYVEIFRQKSLGNSLPYASSYAPGSKLMSNQSMCPLSRTG